MTKTPQQTDVVLIDEDEILNEELADPELRAEWEERAPARAFANAIIAIRAKEGLTQKEFAQRLGMNQPQISRLEAGEHVPDLKTLVRVAAGFDIELMIDIKPASRDAALPKRRSLGRGSVTELAGAYEMVLATA